MKTKTLLFLLLLSATLSAQVKIYHGTKKDDRAFSGPYGYLVGDSVALRNDSSLAGSVISTLRIGTSVEMLEKTDAMTTLRGMESSWYKIKAGALTGWVWGGFITDFAEGSNKDPDVKFLYAFSHVAEKKMDDGYGHTYTQRNTYMQIRAVKNNVQLSKIVFEMNASYFQPYIFGNKGIEGVDDIIAVGEPCEGGCGCSGWDHYIFWDGEKLHYVIAVGGTADASFSEGDGIIFPSDMSGEKGYIQIAGNFIDTSYNYNAHGDVMRRVMTNTYYTWNGTKLVKAPGKKVKPQYYYYNYEEDKIVDKPEEEKPEGDGE